MPGAQNIRIGTRIYIPLILAADSEAPLNEGCGGLLAANLLPRSLRIVRHIYVCVVHCELMFIVHPVVMRDLPPPPLSTVHLHPKARHARCLQLRRRSRHLAPIPHTNYALPGVSLPSQQAKVQKTSLQPHRRSRLFT